MKGIILAGGAGSRLYPLTQVASKQLQPVYDKPMVYYPLTTLIECGIRELCLISTPHDLPSFRKLLGNGSECGVAIDYREQAKPQGIAEAFRIADTFIGSDPVALILGDNIFTGSEAFFRAVDVFDGGATIFGYHVTDPERYGVVEVDAAGHAISIEEKPAEPHSNYAVPGLYIYDNEVVQIARDLAPGPRGELEITDVNLMYLKAGRLKVIRLPRGVAWLDAGTSSSLHEASAYVQAVEKRQGTKLGCPEEAAFRRGFIGLDRLKAIADKMPACEYHAYIEGVIQERYQLCRVPEKYILLGGSGYIGTAFRTELERRGLDYLNLSRSAVDYTQFDTLLNFLRAEKPSFLINCAGYTGKPNVDACEAAKADTMLGNVTLPQTIANACAAAGVPWGHVSSGCIYAGAKVAIDGCWRVERNLMDPAVRRLWKGHPERLAGFAEDDSPNFSFRSLPCSFYSGSKAFSEEILAGAPEMYIWRLRIPFDHEDNPRNYLTKIQRYPRVYSNANSLSHRHDFAKACLDLWQMRAPFGIYNVTNPGWVTARAVVQRMKAVWGLERRFEFFENDRAFYRTAAATPRSNAILDVTKLLDTGVEIRPVEDALDAALTNWTVCGANAEQPRRC